MKDRSINPPFAFPQQRVYPSGYQWKWLAGTARAGAAASRAPRLTFWHLVPVDSDESPRRYDPFTENALFRTFAAIPPEREAIAEFARKYGLLGVAAPDIKGEDRFAESLMVWDREISAMWKCVSLWEPIAGRQIDRLREIVQCRWEGERMICEINLPDQIGSESLRVGRTQGWIRADSPYFADLLDSVRHGDIMKLARFTLAHKISMRLREYKTLPLLMEDPVFRLVMQPESLIAALWLQFANAVASHHTLRTCIRCGKWFRVGVGGDHRADAQYCSNACRQQKYLERRQKTEIERKRKKERRKRTSTQK